jgi:hypothetical protein
VVVVTVAGGVVVVAGTATAAAADVFFIFLENCLPSVSFGTRQRLCRVPDKWHTANDIFADV